MRNPLRIALLTALTAAGVATATVASVTAAVAVTPAEPITAAAVPDAAVFNDPNGTAAEQQRIVTYVQSLINGTPAGQDIRMSMFHYDLPAITADLVAARDRGVRVKVIIDHESANTAATQSLIAQLGTNRSATSWVTLCTAGAACIGTTGTPINHNKFYLFSQTNGSANVVVQSSANLTPSNATRYYNNAVSLTGNVGLYNGYLSYFNDLANKAKNSDYYRTVGSGNAKAYYFPRAGTDESSDTIYNMLNENVTCEGNTSTGTPTFRTVIRVAMWYFSRDDIARKLRELAGEKCWVEIIYTNADAGSLGHLQNHDRIKLYHVDGTNIVHSKYMLIEGTYAGARDSKWVVTGSHNWTNAALRENDEAMIRINSNALHDQYRANFLLMRGTVD